MESSETIRVGATPIPAPEALALTHPNPVRGRINAAFFRVMDWYMHWKYAALKTRLFADLPPEVVELGAGVGANFRYLPRGTRVTAIEPNHHMHDGLAASARRWGVEVDIRGLGGEGLPLADASVDAVICSLVLCTVADPAQVLAEVRRVLRPGGRFVCIEHVAAPRHTWVGRLQRWVFRPWRWFFEGCHTHRDTGALLAAAGFEALELEAFDWPSVFVPVRPQIAAVATR